MSFAKPGKNRGKTENRSPGPKSAKWARCVRCGAQDGTVVPAHYSGFRKFRYGRGLAMKVDDRLVANLCRTCHETMDTVRTDDVAHSEEFLHLIALTIIDDSERRVF
jgi:hypothetical protein